MKFEQRVRMVVGIVFAAAGAAKLLLLPLIAWLRPGTPTFGAVLAAIHVPLPAVTAVAVCLAEMAGGLALLRGRFVRLACVLLIGDMLGAMVSLSIPATFFRQPAHVGGLTVGNEFWRVPLEATLLGLLVWLATRRPGTLPSS